MSLLEEILETVKTKGHSDVPLLSLYKFYFRGEDWLENLKAWSDENNLKFSITPPDYYDVPDSQRTVRFYL